MPAGNDKESAEAVLSAGFAGKYRDRISNRSLEKLVLSRAIRRHTGHRILVQEIEKWSSTDFTPF